MEDVLEVYQRPYDPQRPVICLDEKLKELHHSPQGSLPLQSGQPVREDYHYERHGTANLFLSVEPLTGKVQLRVTAQRTKADFAQELRQIVEVEQAQADKVVLVTDNLNIHNSACLYEHFPPAQARAIAAKIEWHYTPEHGSWLNIAECQLSVLARQCLNRRFPDQQTLTSECAAWLERHNRSPVAIDWHFNSHHARLKLKRLYPLLKEQKPT